VSASARFAVGALLATAVVVVYAPALSFELIGDDYQMAQLARRALDSPALLLAPIGEFFRPVSTWLLAADRLAWGTDPRGYHLTTLALQVIATLLLVAAARRLGVGRAASWVAGLVWACSPFASEVAVWAAVRHEQTLLIAWLVLVLAWPAHGERWSRGRIAAAVAAMALAALSKETWVVTPGLVAILLASVERAYRRRATLITATVTAAVAAYAVARFLAFPSFRGYYEFAAAPLAKVPQMVAAFLALGGLEPAPASASVTSLAVTAALVGLIVAGRRRPAVAVGAALLFLPMLPVLFVPFMPLRYAHVPFAGFVLLAAGGVAAGLDRLPPALHRTGAAVALTGVGLVGAVWIGATRDTLADVARVSRAHRVLLAEARAFAPRLPTDRPVVVLRLDRTSILDEVARFPVGWPQPWFARHADPAALVDAAALFEWASDDRRVSVRRLDDWPAAASGAVGSVIAHGPGGFRMLAERVEDTADVAAHWSREGTPLRVIRVATR
jgi:hypothetical protein